MDSTETPKPMRYYVDFENVHGSGLKGIDELNERDEVYVFYSQAAETFHIEHVIDIMKSKARIEFVEIDGGTRNSLDFQLVAALFGMMEEGFDYAIVSGDGGFDAAIRMGKRLDLPEVRRITDLTGSTEPVKAKSSRSRRSRNKNSNGQNGNQKQSQASNAHSTLSAQKNDAKTEAPAEFDEHEQGLAPIPEKPPITQDQEQLPAPKEVAGNSEPDQPGTETQRAAEAQANTASEKTGGRYKNRREVKALLAENGAKLDSQQLSSVMSALNGVKNKQQFYRRIVASEGRARGLALYHQVRDHYEAMMEILRS